MKAVLFESMSEVVRAALDIVEHKTSIQDVVNFCNRKLASKEWKIPSDSHAYIRYGLVSNVRHYWKKTRKIKGDCRTYATQTRRSMLPDNKISKKDWEKLQHLSLDWQEVKAFLNLCHSKEQALKAVETMQQAETFVEA